MERCSWYMSGKGGRLQKKTVEDFPTFFTYICIEKRQIYEKMFVWFRMVRLKCFIFSRFFADQHFLQWAHSNFIRWGKEDSWILLTQNKFRFLYFPSPAPPKSRKRGLSPSLQHLMRRCWKTMKAFVFLVSFMVLFCWLHQNYSESSVAEQLSLTTSNCRTPGNKFRLPERKTRSIFQLIWTGGGGGKDTGGQHHQGVPKRRSKKCPNVTQH